MKTHLSKNEASCLTLSQDIKEFCSTIFENSMITDISYARMNMQGGLIHISSNQKWLESYFLA